MDMTFTEEHEQLREVLHKFLTDRSSEEAVRALMDSERGYDEGVWKQLAQELGLVGLIIPEKLGGAGLGPVELVVVFEEMGRALLCAPFLSTAVLATSALLASGDVGAQERLLTRIAAGECIATLAICEGRDDWSADAGQLTATAVDGGYALSGTKTSVLDAHVADVLLVVARTSEGLSLFEVDPSARGVTCTQLAALDPTRRIGRVDLDAAPATLIGSAGAAQPAVERALDLAATALAAEQVGGASACLEMAVEYGKTRIQFGRPIGSFQAIKHRCADLLAKVELAKSAAYQAGFCAAERPAELPRAASMAQSYCSEAYLKAAGDNLQIHGGLGFTWEAAPHLYLKRAKSSELLFGDPLEHRERLAELLEL
jgi:alkylation response protein AidB-like acyl-CoA dehydrogenase